MRVGHYVRVIDEVNMANIVDNLVKFYKNAYPNQTHSACQEIINKYCNSITTSSPAHLFTIRVRRKRG